MHFNFLIIPLILLVAACSSRPLTPDKTDIKVSREKADSDCRELGPVMGRLITTRGTAEEALEDLKQDAANKGANFVVINQYSDQQTSVTGTAYICP